jgi:YfiH family protein
MSFLGSRMLEDTGAVRFALSTRNGGVSPPPLGMNLSFRVGDDPACVDENRRLLLRHIASTPDRLALPLQVHSATVRRIDCPGQYADCDGLITATAGVVIGVSIADCVPVFLVDPRLRVIAAVHAGWRGTVAGIATAAVRAMEREFGSRPEDLAGFIGPSAAACCYVVGEEVASQFPSGVTVRGKLGIAVDLKRANLNQLTAAGVCSDRVEVSPHCTITESSLFHSFRRDRERSGRMMGVLRLIHHPVR